MKTGWKETTIGEMESLGMANVKTGPFGTKLKAHEYTTPLISVREIKIGRIVIEAKTPRVSKEIQQRMPEYLLEEGDIVFARKGGVERNARITKEQNGFFLGSDGLRIRFNPSVNTKYLSSYFQSKKIRAWLVQHSTGATMPSLSGRILSLLPVILPPTLEQKRIAHVLGTLDDKIELNRKMNKTLEAMAQALFKSWFVDFDPVIDNAIRAGNPIPKDLEEKAERRRKVMARDSYKISKYADIFPDSFVDSELGSIPKGLEAEFLNNIIEIISGGTPKRSEPRYWGGEIPWFSVRDAPSNSDLFVNRTKETISEDGLESCSANLVPSWTTIISARGTVGKLALTTQEMTFNQSCYGIRPTLGYGEKFVYFTIKNTVDLLKKGAHGSVFDTITRKTFEVVRIVKPPRKNAEIFESHMEGILRKIKLNVENSNHLAGIRNLLLPKLITGEIRLPINAEL